jgi:hypothetical protein
MNIKGGMRAEMQAFEIDLSRFKNALITVPTCREPTTMMSVTLTDLSTMHIAIDYKMLPQGFDQERVNVIDLLSMAQ